MNTMRSFILVPMEFNVFSPLYEGIDLPDILVLPLGKNSHQELYWSHKIQE